MSADSDAFAVLACYSGVCRGGDPRALGSAGGFSGAQFWQVVTPQGPLCLRRWPKEYPPVDRLQYIQAVLRHVAGQGFESLPVPLPNDQHEGYVHRAGYLWELAPWMPGAADFRDDPTEAKLEAALIALGTFHLAAATFPTSGVRYGPSPGIAGRLDRLRRWLAGDLDHLATKVQAGLWPDLEPLAWRILRLVPEGADEVLALLSRSAGLDVPIQPCIRDVWHNHVLFDGARVSGLIDFGSMSWGNVGVDVARLLGSLAQDDDRWWEVGLAAYQSVRPLSAAELALLEAFDRSTVLMAGLNWIDWIYRQRRVFENRAAIPGRLEGIVLRLEHLVHR